MKMQRSAVNFAVKHWISLGRGEDGFYYIANQANWTSEKPTAKSAIDLMKRFLKHNNVKSMPRRSILDLKRK